MGEWKPVFPFGGATIVQTVVGTALRVCPRVILVVGYRSSELEELFAGEPRVKTLLNPDWELGMFSSIQRGITLVETQRFFITLGDMPFLDPEVYAGLLAFTPADVVIPTFSGSDGHPVLIHERVKPIIMSADPATGSMREIVHRFPIHRMPWKDDTILRDIDTIEDYGDFDIRRTPS